MKVRDLITLLSLCDPNCEVMMTNHGKSYVRAVHNSPKNVVMLTDQSIYEAGARVE